ncbi:MAG: SsrA-binding protein SmpB [Candidatus Margulisbacteria bacterium]|nr:SsrA-binding protein SmpB [Candidatus Margulisiibacteriota bacterium]
MTNSFVNKKAWFNYEMIETFEAGIALLGNEVKSIRSGKLNISEAFIRIKDGEATIHNMEIQTYEKVNTFQQISPTRTRKLLLKRNEISKLIGKINEKGLTLIALKVYFKKQYVKLELGLGKGKKMGDKRETIKTREIDREISRAFKYR